MIHLVTLNPALDLELDLKDPSIGKIGEVLFSDVEAGGKALNVARFLKKNRVPFKVWLGTGGGQHPTHVLFKRLLEREGLKARFLSSTAPVRLNVVTKKGKTAQKYNHLGFELDLTLFGRLYQAVKKNDLLVLTGRLPKGMNDALYGSWIKSFNRKGVRTVVDTSGRPLAEALKARPWFFKVNLFELSEAFHRKFSNLRQVQKFWPRLVKMGLLHGAVTNGKEGALIWNGSEVCWVKSSVEVRGSLVVGAGDGFLAGYLKGLASRNSFWNCAKQACATATVVARLGIQGFDPRIVSPLLKNVKVKRFV